MEPYSVRDYVIKKGGVLSRRYFDGDSRADVPPLFASPELAQLLQRWPRIIAEVEQ